MRARAPPHAAGSGLGRPRCACCTPPRRLQINLLHYGVPSRRRLTTFFHKPEPVPAPIIIVVPAQAQVRCFARRLCTSVASGSTLAPLTRHFLANALVLKHTGQRRRLCAVRAAHRAAAGRRLAARLPDGGAAARRLAARLPRSARLRAAARRCLSARLPIPAGAARHRAGGGRGAGADRCSVHAGDGEHGCQAEQLPSRQRRPPGLSAPSLFSCERVEVHVLALQGALKLRTRLQLGTHRLTPSCQHRAAAGCTTRCCKHTLSDGRVFALRV